MFSINPNPTFNLNVEISVPGKSKPAKVEFVFKHRDREALKSLMDEFKTLKDQDAVAKIVSGWVGVDADYNEENLATFLNNYPLSAGEIISAYCEELFQGKAKVKN